MANFEKDTYALIGNQNDINQNDINLDDIAFDISSDNNFVSFEQTAFEQEAFEQDPPQSLRKKLCWGTKQFGKHFLKQFKPREVLNSVVTHPFLLASLVIVVAIGIVLGVRGLPYNSLENIFSAWTFVTLVHLGQVVAALGLPNEPLIKRILKVLFHIFLAALCFLYWYKMGDWMHYGFHHFLYASICLFYTFERLGKSFAIVIGVPLAISDIVGYGEFPIFSKPHDFSGLDDVLKERPWVFLVPAGILFICELLVEGPLVQSFRDIKNLPNSFEEY